MPRRYSLMCLNAMPIIVTALYRKVPETNFPVGA